MYGSSHGVVQVVMLRSLTSYVRLLPGYRMYKACKVLQSNLQTCCQSMRDHKLQCTF